MMLKRVRRPMGGFFVAAALMASFAPVQTQSVGQKGQEGTASVSAAQVLGPRTALQSRTAPDYDEPDRSKEVKLSRTDVNELYWRNYGRYGDERPEDSSNLNACKPGSFNDVDARIQARALNFMRRLNGLGPVRASNSANERAQAAALAMAANRKLSHVIDPSWTCWSNLAQHGAATSNLALAYSPMATPAWVQLYMDDPGDTNHAVGHRRWLMFPQLDVVGFGSVAAPSGATGSAITVLEVKRKRTAPNPAWTAWPSAGPFPTPLSTSRWSLSSGNDFAKFHHARVRVTDVKKGEQVSLTQLPVHDGYGKPTLVWDMGTFDANSTFEVRVRNVKLGDKRVKHTYRVKMFTPWAIS